MLKSRRLGLWLLPLLILLPVWGYFMVSSWNYLPEDFVIEMAVRSEDNFYDSSTEEFAEPIESRTTFSYREAGRQDDVYLVNNLFDVKTPNGEPIFAVERLYGVDPYTGMHVADYGDREREGYLFAPRGLKPNQEFTYWHINYDGPAQMVFQGETEVAGLPVYQYFSDYPDVEIDQTKNLGNLPGVPEERGVILEPQLTIYVEPVTGWIIDYADNTTAYYYDIDTGDKIEPWNRFTNHLTESSKEQQVQVVSKMRTKILAAKWYLPVLVLAYLLFGAVYFVIRRRNA